MAGRDLPTNPHEDLWSVLTEQRREFMAAQELESDRELAFHLQLQEALAASLVLQPSTSTSSILESQHTTNTTTTTTTVTENDGVSGFAACQSDDFDKWKQEIKDREESEAEMKRVKEELSRRFHDEKFAREILRIREDDWREWGDNYEKPLYGGGEGCSKSKNVALEDEDEDEDEDNDNDAVFRLYTKGLVSVEDIRGEKSGLAGIGVAICDPNDKLIFEVRKPLIGNGMSKNAAEAKALIEGLNVALALDLKRLNIYFDSFPLYKFVNGRWAPRQRKIAVLVNQIKVLRRKFLYFNPMVVVRNDVKFALKLARDAIISQVTRPAETSGDRNVKEACVICLEDTDVSQMFSVDGCQHRFCVSCMKQHVEVKLLHGMLPKCPHEGCKSELLVDSCRKFLTSKSIETMNQRIKEASIPIAEKVYCPNPRCSTLMSKSDVFEYSKDFLDVRRSVARKCMKCHGLFCIDCKVPWHSNLTCYLYKMLNPNPAAEDVKLKSLATRNLWRQCVKCNHMIELAEGCYHMTCRCGFEFCYNCGAEWKNKKATCSCPLWDEQNIWDEENEEDDDDAAQYYDSDSDYYSDY